MGETHYTCVVMLTKISILLLYLRIFPSTVSTWFRTTWFIFIAVCATGMIGMVLAIAFECNPVAGAYNAWDGEHPATCIDTHSQLTVMAGINIVLDLAVFFLPIPKVVKLETSTQKKIGVCMTFLVGLFVTVVSIIRLVELVQHISTSNPTWEFNPIGIWSQAEVNVGVLCACMPSFARLIRQFWSVTVGPYVTSKISNRYGSRISKKKSEQWQFDDGGRLKSLSSHGVAKAASVASVYERKLESSDELELVEKYPSVSTEGKEHDHRYRRDW